MARLGTLRLRHRQHVLGLAFSPDGNTLVSTGWGGAIRFWDLRTGEPLRRFGEGSAAEFGVAFSPDGSKLATTASRGLVRLWEVSTGRELWKTQKHEDRTYGVAFSPDGFTLATAGDDEAVRLWDVATGEQLLNLRAKGRVRDSHAVAFSPDGNRLASGHQGGIHLWDLQSGAEPVVIEQGRDHDIVSLLFTRDGKRLISGGDRLARLTDDAGKRLLRRNAEILLWEVATGKLLGQLKPQEPDLGDCCLALSGDGKLLVSVHRDRLRVWDVETGQVTRTIEAETCSYGRRTHGVAVSRDGRRVAAGWGDNAVRVWDITTGRPLLEFPDAHTHYVTTVHYCPDGKLAATGSADATVRLWNPATGKMIRKFPPSTGWVRSVWFSPNGKTVFAAGEGRDEQTPRFIGRVDFLEAEAGRRVRTICLPDRVMAAALSRDGKLLATATGLAGPFFGEQRPEFKIWVWDTQTAEKLAELVGHQGQIMGLAFAPDDKWLVSVGEDRTVRQWDLHQRSEVKRRDFPADDSPLFNCGCFSADAETVLLGGLARRGRNGERTGNNKLLACRWTTGEALFAVEMSDHWPNALAVSPDGRVLAASLRPVWDAEDPTDRRIVLYDARSGQERLRRSLDEGWVLSLAFSPDGRQLISAMDRGTALVWDVSDAYDKLED